MATIPGIRCARFKRPLAGRSAGKPINLPGPVKQPDAQAHCVESYRVAMDKELAGSTDCPGTRPLPGVEWRLAVNRSEAARFGADIL